ncbi:hypothetical protein SLEP1_g17230 [Rubroshorea leprosula]|uniref:Uncharacterized protein n=1 Tax=Rubroshorea leprosula TaxID=152421 RepID=A0AAV5J2T2_9ROSI|nr:hypothetical protein SLEP1_g17230 [Rubroshorea leprosula]
MKLPMIDLEPYLKITSQLNGDSAKEKADIRAGFGKLCSEVSRVLKETWALLVNDPRCTAKDNDRFLDMMEKKLVLGIKSVTWDYV